MKWALKCVCNALTHHLFLTLSYTVYTIWILSCECDVCIAHLCGTWYKALWFRHLVGAVRADQNKEKNEKLASHHHWNVYMKIRLIYSVQHIPYGLRYHIYDFNLHLHSLLIENGFEHPLVMLLVLLFRTQWVFCESISKAILNQISFKRSKLYKNLSPFSSCQITAGWRAFFPISVPCKYDYYYWNIMPQINFTD